MPVEVIAVCLAVALIIAIRAGVGIWLFHRKPKTVCAWCMKERGETARREDSHGICERHSAELLANAASDALMQVRCDFCQKMYLNHPYFPRVLCHDGELRWQCDNCVAAGGFRRGKLVLGQDQ